MAAIPVRRARAWTICLAVALLCAGCMKGDPAPSTISGTATWRERIALPPGTRFEATLEDVSRADAPAEILGRTLVDAPGNPPVAFSIPYDADRIDPKHRYSVRGRITKGNLLLFTTDTHYPVLGTPGADHVELLLRMVGSTAETVPVPEPIATAALEDTYWKLMKLGGEPVIVSDVKREPHFILHPADGNVSGSGGCNRLVGSYSLDGDRIRFGQTAGTMMACPQGMEQEQVFHKALLSATRWQVTGETLQLFDADGALLAVFETRYLK